MSLWPKSQPSAPSKPTRERGGEPFPVTQWSLVLDADGSDSTAAHAALDALCRRYWYPLYAYIRRQGRDHHEAEDCTQAFLLKLLQAGGIARARQERGRFRTYLLTSLRYFLTSDWRRVQAQRRGSGDAGESLSLVDAENRFLHQPADTGLTPEQAFDRTWARGMIESAVDRLRSEYESTGRSSAFAAFLPLLWESDSAETLAQHAARTNMSERAFTVGLSRLRQRVGEHIRASVLETISNPADLEQELRELITALETPRP